MELSDKFESEIRLLTQDISLVAKGYGILRIKNDLLLAASKNVLNSINGPLAKLADAIYDLQNAIKTVEGDGK